MGCGTSNSKDTEDPVKRTTKNARPDQNGVVAEERVMVVSADEKRVLRLD